MGTKHWLPEEKGIEIVAYLHELTRREAVYRSTLLFGDVIQRTYMKHLELLGEYYEAKPHASNQI